MTLQFSSFDSDGKGKQNWYLIIGLGIIFFSFYLVHFLQGSEREKAESQQQQLSLTPEQGGGGGQLMGRGNRKRKKRKFFDDANGGGGGGGGGGEDDEGDGDGEEWDRRSEDRTSSSPTDTPR